MADKIANQDAGQSGKIAIWVCATVLPFVLAIVLAAMYTGGEAGAGLAIIAGCCNLVIIYFIMVLAFIIFVLLCFLFALLIWVFCSLVIFIMGGADITLLQQFLNNPAYVLPLTI